MLKITVDNQEIRPNTIWYHHQNVPKPGGHDYCVIISVEEPGVRTIEKVIGRKITAPSFLRHAKELDQSHANLIQYILHKLPEDQKKNWNVEWVFNTVDKVELQGNFLIIKGRCSESRPDLFR